MFDIVKPCDDCPFRRSGGIRLRKGRADDIAGMMLSPDGGAFWCHKTTGTGCDKSHCAGALMFAEKNDNATQAMRIASRLRLYDRDRLVSNDAAMAETFDTLEEMIEAQDD